MAPRLLLVDGMDDLKREKWDELAAETGVEIVAVAESEDQTRAFVEELSPDVVLLNVDNPKLGGMEICNRIFEMNPWMKIAVLTQACDPIFVMGAFRSHACAYILKRCLPMDFKKAIDTIMKGKVFLSPALCHPKGFVTSECRFYIEQLHRRHRLRMRNGCDHDRGFEEVAWNRGWVVLKRNPDSTKSEAATQSF